MPELIKRQEVPNSWQVGLRGPEAPKVRLHKGGTLFFSVLAAEVLGDRDCRLLLEWDEQERTLKFTAVEKLPDGVEEADTFPMRIRVNPGAKRPIGMLSVKALLSYLGFKYRGQPEDFPIAALDKRRRSITLVLP